jgi:hypothetical protein
MFQSRDWVDVYSGFSRSTGADNGASPASFNPATGLMFIPASTIQQWQRICRLDSFNPATGLMFIPAVDRNKVIEGLVAVSIPRLG